MQNVTRRRKKPPVLTGDGLDGLTVPQLKDKLRPLQLKLAGRKSELVARLRAHYASSDGSEALPRSSTRTRRSLRASACWPPPADADAGRGGGAVGDPAAAPEEPDVVPETTAAAGRRSPPASPRDWAGRLGGARRSGGGRGRAAGRRGRLRGVRAGGGLRGAVDRRRGGRGHRQGDAAGGARGAARGGCRPARRGGAVGRCGTRARPRPPAPEVKRVPRLSSVLASISLATGAVAEAAAARAPRREVTVQRRPTPATSSTTPATTRARRRRRRRRRTRRRASASSRRRVAGRGWRATG